jgi:hypothetical protein
MRTFCLFVFASEGLFCYFKYKGCLLGRRICNSLRFFCLYMPMKAVVCFVMPMRAYSSLVYESIVLLSCKSSGVRFAENHRGGSN